MIVAHLAELFIQADQNAVCVCLDVNERCQTCAVNHWQPISTEF